MGKTTNNHLLPAGTGPSLACKIGARSGPVPAGNCWLLVVFSMTGSFLALYCNKGGGNCLNHLGTEGGPSKPQTATGAVPLF